jgi:ABC-type dipeptide/oligopeptide/nickel transport system ATPase component
VHGVTFALKPGDRLGIVGESGSGKTLTCRSLVGILPPVFVVSGGRVELDGQDIASFSERDWRTARGRTITAVFQDPGSYFTPSIRIGAHLVEILRVTRGFRRGEARARALALLERVHLRDPHRVYRSFPHELSGGMLQRALIASALALEPRVLIADEVTTALDVTVQAEILDLLLDLVDEYGLALIIVSHDLAVVAQTTDEVLVLRDGHVVEQGATQRVLRNPEHAYTRALVDEHEVYGLERFLATEVAHVG